MYIEATHLFDDGKEMHFENIYNRLWHKVRNMIRRIKKSKKKTDRTDPNASAYEGILSFIYVHHTPD